MEDIYSPPLNIRVFDKRLYGQLPMVGIHVIKILKDRPSAHPTATQSTDSNSYCWSVL